MTSILNPFILGPGLMNYLPVNTVAPFVSVAGPTASTTSGTWTGSPSFSYAWYAGFNSDGSDASTIGVTISTLNVGGGEGISYFFCKVTGANVFGSTVANSNIIGPY